jgi:hypothetical protein
MTFGGRPFSRTPRAWHDGPTAVYRQFSAAGDLLYIGMSQNPAKRCGAITTDAHWVTQVETIKVEWFPSKMEARAAESEAIRAERPLHNVQHNRSKRVAA